MARLASLTVATTVAVLLWPLAGSAQYSKKLTWSIDGETRHAIVYPPFGPRAIGRAPVVLAFHGHGDDAEHFQVTGIHDAWPEAVVVYFQGLPSQRDGLPGWQVEKGEDNDRDLKLVDAALASLPRDFSVDPRRVYATGFSNGANFTYLLWAERPEVFAAYAPVAARLRPSVQPTEPKPLLHVAGRQDMRILFADQENAIETAKRVNGVGGSGTSCGNGCTKYGTTRTNALMTWIHPGGHTYPAGTADRIVRFFADYRLESRPAQSRP
jgi:polyhydroxybutyrate depolymerase